MHALAVFPAMAARAQWRQRVEDKMLTLDALEEKISNNRKAKGSCKSTDPLLQFCVVKGENLRDMETI